MATSDGGGVAWRTNPEWTSEARRAAYPEGYLDLGVAHGLAGVVPVLAGALAGGVEVSRASSLLSGALKVLLRHESATVRPSAFPSFVHGRDQRTESRVAWCYGDLGVAGALLGAAEALADEGLRQRAVAVAARLATSDAERFGVRDASVCHGSAGVAHFFIRMHAATGDETFAHAAALWARRVLAARVPGRTGGFLYETSIDLGASKLEPNRSLLEGTSGIGLVLLEALGLDPRAAWDGVLGWSLPPRKGAP
jgi:lantibiotic modifying enzyme